MLKYTLAGALIAAMMIRCGGSLDDPDGDSDDFAPHACVSEGARDDPGTSCGVDGRNCTAVLGGVPTNG